MLVLQNLLFTIVTLFNVCVCVHIHVVKGGGLPKQVYWFCSIYYIDNIIVCMCAFACLPVQIAKHFKTCPEAT